MLKRIVEHHIHIHWDAPMILETLKRIDKRTKAMALDLTDLTAAVEEDRTVDESAMTLLQHLTDLLEQNIDNPEVLRELVAKIRAQSQALADAVVANTPAE